MIIGLAGFSLVGKTSIAKAIAAVNHYPIHSFAGELKRRIDPLFPPKTEKKVKRSTYVAYGCAMRAIDPDYWIKELSAKFLLSEPSFILDDIRFCNEIEWVRSRGGVVFLIQREGVIPANDEEWASFGEMPQLPVILNNSTVEAARDEILAGVLV